MVRLMSVVMVLISMTLGPWTSLSFAQTKIPRIGILTHLPRDHAVNRAFEKALAANGWVDGKTVVLEYRLNQADVSKLAQDAAELIRLGVDAIYANGVPALRAAFATTRTIPIVAIDMSSDPIESGYAESYSHPGRNVTGVFLDAPEIAGKWIEILKILVPKLTRVLVIWDPGPGTVFLEAVRSSANTLDVKSLVAQVRTIQDIEKAFSMSKERVQAAILVPSPLIYAQLARIGDIAKKRRVPTITLFPDYAEVGGALGYGPSIAQIPERNAAQMARILAGAKAGDQPLERPTKFEFTVNVKTIEEIGLALPTEIQLRADRFLH